MDGQPPRAQGSGAACVESCHVYGCPCQLLTAPRSRQVLHRLIAGDAEKQVAEALGIQASTAHQYVSGIYRHFRVSSRSELLAYVIAEMQKAWQHHGTTATQVGKPLTNVATIPTPSEDQLGLSNALSDGILEMLAGRGPRENRRGSRLRVCQGGTVVRLDESVPLHYRVWLWDISSCGVSFIHVDMIETDVRLLITMDGAPRPSERLATVRHNHFLKAGEFRVGAEFEA